jgi:hypothetical protein
MKQYMVAYADLFENTIRMEQVSAENELQAILNTAFVKHSVTSGTFTLATIKEFFFDCDSLIEVKEIH